MTPVVLALGSNLRNRSYLIRAALLALRRVMKVTRVSSIYKTEPVDCPPGAPSFLNVVLAGHTRLTAAELLGAVQRIEAELGRRRGVRNAPRTIDIDIVLFGAHMQSSRELTLPHPRYRQRGFVLEPLRELRLPWLDPRTQLPVG